MMKRSFAICCMVMFSLFSASALAQTIGGSVQWNHEEAPQAKPPGHWTVDSPFVPAVDPDVDAAIPAVWLLERVGDPLPVERDTVELVIEDLEFSRPVLAVRSNTIVNMINRSRYAMTIQLLDESNKALEGVVLEAGKTGRLQVPDQGVFTLQAAEFSHLKATVVVTTRGREIMPDAKGAFVLAEMQPGRYRILVWSKRWVEGKPFEIDATNPTVIVTVSARRGAVVGVAVRIKPNPNGGWIPPAPPAPRIPPAPPVVTPPPAPRKVVAPPAPAAPSAPAPKPAAPKTADAPKTTDDDTPKDPGKKTDDEKKDESSGSGGFFKIKELD